MKKNLFKLVALFAAFGLFKADSVVSAQEIDENLSDTQIEESVHLVDEVVLNEAEPVTDSEIVGVEDAVETEVSTEIIEAAEETYVPKAQLADYSISHSEYEKNISGLNRVDLQGVYDLMASEGSLLYIGRPECPYCRIVSPILGEFNERVDGALNYYPFYRDNNEAAELFYNQIGVPGVPTVLEFNSGQVTKGWIGVAGSSDDYYNYFIGG